MSDKKRDVIVVGAGPAGSICAAYLAKAGVDVLLLEKESLPRDKACGDIQREGIVRHMERLGAVADLDSMSTCIRNVQLMGSDGSETLIPFECYCAPRADLDKLLADTAVKHGAELRENCRVTDVIIEQGCAAGVRAAFRGEETELRSSIVIAADGAFSASAGALGIMEEKPSGMWIGERAYFRGVKLDRMLAKSQYDAYGIFAFDKRVSPGWFWIMPVGKDGVKNGICNVGAVMNSRDAFRGERLRDRFSEWVGGSRRISAMFENAQQISPWKGGRFPDITQGTRKAGSGFMMIGDAASLTMPLSFDGISEAADSARAAARAAQAALRKNDVSEAMLMAQYKKALVTRSEEELTESLKETRLLMESMYDPGLMNRIIRKLDNDPVYRSRHL